MSTSRFSSCALTRCIQHSRHVALTRDASSNARSLKLFFFSLSLNVAPPLLPYVQNLIQKKKTGTLGRMHPRMVGRAAMAAAAGAGGGYMCLMPRMQLAPTHRHRCVLVLAPVDHIKMPSTRVYSRPLHAPHPILRHLDAKV